MVHSHTQHRSLLLGVLLTGIFMANVDVAIANVATPSISRGVGATGAAVQFVVAGYTLAYTMLLITRARLGDMRGYGRVFLAGSAVFTLDAAAEPSARVRRHPGLRAEERKEA